MSTAENGLPSLNFTATPAAAGLDTSPYSPDSTIDTYSRADFESNTDYIIETSRERAWLPVLGVVLFLFLLLWNIATACCCRGGGHKLSKTTKAVCTLLLICCTLGMLVGFIYLVATISKSETFIQDIPDVIDYLTYWSNDTVRIISQTSNQIGVCATNQIPTTQNDSRLDLLYNDVVNAGAATSDGTVAYDSVRSGYEGLQIALNELNSSMSSFEIFEDGEVNDFFNDATDPIDTVVLVTWIVFGLAMLQVVIAILNMFAPPKLQPRKCCWLVTPCTTLIYLLIMLVIWILAGAMWITVTINSDFCNDFDNNMLDIGGAENDDTVRYYVLCDHDSNLTNPLSSEIANITRDLDKSNAAVELYVNITDAECAANATTEAGCLAEDVNASQSDLQFECGLVSRYISDHVDLDGGRLRYLPGSLFGQLECHAFNGRVQALANLMCIDLNGLWASYFSAFLAIGIFMFTIEFIRKYTRGQSEEKLQESKKVYPDDGDKV